MKNFSWIECYKKHAKCVIYITFKFTLWTLFQCVHIFERIITWAHFLKGGEIILYCSLITTAGNKEDYLCVNDVENLDSLLSNCPCNGNCLTVYWLSAISLPKVPNSHWKLNHASLFLIINRILTTVCLAKTFLFCNTYCNVHF